MSRNGPDQEQVAIKDYPFFREGSRASVFIHIPKTAGTSIAHALQLPSPERLRGIKKHYSAAEIIPLMGPQAWEQAYCFCFVRNPWDRLFSHYRFRRRKGKLPDQKHHLDFREWARYELEERPPRQRQRSNLKPQSDWLKVGQEVAAMDFIGRFEQLEADFAKICASLQVQAQLPHLLAGSDYEDYRPQYDAYTVDLAANYYREDIERWAYRFE
ncbi:MAG: sulfotransferase family 2 domain-containing protein [Bacteroidota bacterium]